MARKPSIKRFQTVIDNFDKLLDDKNIMPLLDMDNPRIDHTCGTPMCHGGWYGVATKDEALDNYDDGADVMARDLGFAEGTELTKWARLNSDFWGNEDGGFMFSSESAFDGIVNDKSSLNLSKIRDHWAGVRNRCHPEVEPLAMRAK